MLLSHPKRHSDPRKESFDFADGSVVITVPEGEVLTAERANTLFDRVKFIILRALDD